MRISEVFPSLQGEGKYAGKPVLFIRTSGCNRNCSYCDTKYHTNGQDVTPNKLAKTINESNKNVVVFTGGEPMLQIKEIEKTMSLVSKKIFWHLETNGDYLNDKLGLFCYIAFSPKDKQSTEKLVEWLEFKQYINKYDIKIVTDLNMNKELICNATMLMPLTEITDDVDAEDCYEGINTAIEQKVWDYCVEHNIKFCLRQHVKVWGVKKRGI